MAQLLHPDFKAGITHAEATAADKKTHDLLMEQQDALKAESWDYAIALSIQMRENQLRVYKPGSSPIGGTWNALGSIYKQAGRLQEAEDAVEKGLAIYAAVCDYNEMSMARETLAAIKEAQGQFDEARKVRLEGKDRKEISCTSDTCPWTSVPFRMENGGLSKMFALEELKQCAACKAAFYCSKRCQKHDWKTRHKPLCQKHTGAV
ncbi:hypothetical protein CC86DRAFT_472820 [Ophiobolus disseminans]|uniref:MYND-type domain-containing protein n=1 Tax=Ophiobolus disseminans TaxID=1469910 RepID=A0A6A6ZC52_9PLEO|nr:hypothetical protein CC86DRAFT_472820 [Ophiobolus disseminans]